MSKSPLAKSSAPPHRGKSCQYATAEPTTTAAPKVVMMLGVRPARMAPRAIGPTAFRNPSRIDWGIRIMAGGKVMKAGGGWKEGKETEPSIKQVLGPLPFKPTDSLIPLARDHRRRLPLLHARPQARARQPVELGSAEGEPGRVVPMQQYQETDRQASRVIGAPIRHAKPQPAQWHPVILPVRRVDRGERDGIHRNSADAAERLPQLHGVDPGGADHLEGEVRPA